MHVPEPGHERSEGADDRHEPREEDRLGPIAGVKAVRAREVLRVEDARAFAREHTRPDIAADPVVRVVPQKRGRGKHRKQLVDVHVARRGERTGHEQQRITRQEWRHHQPGLAEHDDEEDRVDPRPVICDQPLEVAVEVENDVYEAGEELHGRPAGARRPRRSRRASSGPRGGRDPRARHRGTSRSGSPPAPRSRCQRGCRW